MIEEKLSSKKRTLEWKGRNVLYREDGENMRVYGWLKEQEPHKDNLDLIAGYTFASFTPNERRHFREHLRFLHLRTKYSKVLFEE